MRALYAGRRTPASYRPDQGVAEPQTEDETRQTPVSKWSFLIAFTYSRIRLPFVKVLSYIVMRVEITSPI